jgi:hypothetical protein
VDFPAGGLLCYFALAVEGPSRPQAENQGSEADDSHPIDPKRCPLEREKGEESLVAEVRLTPFLAIGWVVTYSDVCGREEERRQHRERFQGRAVSSGSFRYLLGLKGDRHSDHIIPLR